MLIRKLFLFIFLLVASTSAFAQTKVAFIDATKILKRLPEATDADARLEQLIQTWNEEVQNLQSEYERKRTDFERRKLIMTDAERAANDLDVQNARKRLEDFRQSKFGAAGELFQQQSQLMKPAYDKLTAAIKDAATENGYDYILDRSSRDVAILYANGKHDLTLVVAKKLGIETDVLTQPLLNNTNQPSRQQSQQPERSTNDRMPDARTTDRPPTINKPTPAPSGAVSTPH